MGWDGAEEGRNFIYIEGIKMVERVIKEVGHMSFRACGTGLKSIWLNVEISTKGRSL